ncbi:hormone-sensitive lipase [Moelleriella libera RCEF 2490]|uniref:Hormone-sensitive lipase n=1 Tax=Moelleriella libera RCEF 2490 TaxID=1081109 RepID=A0A168E033_9HYPO|nr:hormone-sensitive lipase [Moelleriella libera RCEF 2490]
MIDHILGRPSSKSRRLQVLAVLSFWSVFLYRGHEHGPPGAQSLSRLFTKRLTAWQISALTLIYFYAARNFSTLVGLASPEPMANMYDTTYFRATWVLTALDAGFWTAMKIKIKWLRDIASILFSLFYLVAAERADEKVRKVRGMITVEHLRVGWNKGTTPYLRVLQRLMRPRFTRWPPRQIRIPRPPDSDYKEPVIGWLYYDGPLTDLAQHNRLILDIPGGGFVAMDPRCNDDKLLSWASKSGLPVLSLDYKKAPEFPYPYAVNEIFDVYAAIVNTKGRCIGLSGHEMPRIVLTGDSAGANLTVAATLMIVETSDDEFKRFAGRSPLPTPDGLVCFYPALDMNIGNWMTDEQMALIRDRKMRKTNRSVARRKDMLYDQLVGTPHHSDDEDEAQAEAQDETEAVEMPKSPHLCQPQFSHSGPQSFSRNKDSIGKGKAESLSHHSQPMRTRLATSSMISYFNDRVLTPEMMRAMIILYIGPHNRPDFSQDYLLSPVLAPESLLAKFPKTYFMTGERDPLVDDTVIFAGRLRKAKEALAREDDRPFDATEAAEVALIPGVSHGFMQFPGIYPPAWKHFERCVLWFEQLFLEAESNRTRDDRLGPLPSDGSKVAYHQQQRQHHQHQGESSGDEDKPLEMSMTRMNRGRSKTVAGAATKGASPPAEKNKKKIISKNKSLIKLKSTDDLLSRRMEGLAGGLTGTGQDN